MLCGRERDHWVYVGTVFRLDHRGQSAGGRAIISQRAYACTRLGVEALLRQLHRQAIDCGLGQACDVLVIADGAAWIWNAVQDRFPGARGRLDLYHADEHLWTVANELHGKGTPEATAGDEALLCLETFWHNDRWHALFPHAKPPTLANN